MSFDAVADAKALRKAMKGFGTDEKGLNDVIAHRTNAQLVEIVETYSKVIERDLIKDIKSETSGEYENLLVALLSSHEGYCADVVYNAVHGMGTDENHLIEVLTLRSPAELFSMSQIYQARYKKDMLVHVKGDVSGHFGDALVALMRHAVQNEGKAMPTPPPEQLDADVDALYAAGKGKIGTDEAKFVEIICGNNREYLRELSDAYAKKHGDRLDKVISSEMSGNLKKVLQYRVRPAGEILAERIKDALDGINNKGRVTRLVACNKETHLPEANQYFLTKYGKTLPKYLYDELSGDYKNLVTATAKQFGDISIAEQREADRLAAKLAQA